MQIISRQETKELYPNIYKHGVVAMVVFQKRGRTYQAGERANGSMTKAVQVPATECAA